MTGGTMMSVWRCWTRGVWLVVLAGACVVTTPPPRDTAQDMGPRLAMEAPGAPSEAPASSDGRAALGFVLESSLRARRKRCGLPSADD